MAVSSQLHHLEPYFLGFLEAYGCRNVGQQQYQIFGIFVLNEVIPREKWPVLTFKHPVQCYVLQGEHVVYISSMASFIYMTTYMYIVYIE